MKKSVLFSPFLLAMLSGYCQDFPPPQNPTGEVIGWNTIHLYWNPPARELASYNVYVNGGILCNTTDTEYFDTVFYAYVRGYHITAVYENPDGESDPEANGIWIGIPELQMFPYFQGFEEQRIVLATSAIIGNDFWDKTTIDPLAGNQAAFFYSETFGNVSRIYSPGFYDYSPKGNVEVGFWYQNKNDQNNTDELFFLFTSSSDWIKIGPLPVSENWSYYDTIVPYMGGMQFGFDAVCKNGGGILIDNIELSILPVGMADEIPDKEFLKQNYPNPCTSVTSISFNIVNDGYYNLMIYDLSGKKEKSVFNKHFIAGEYTMSIDISELKAGTHYYRLEGMDKEQTRVMLIE